MKYLAGLLIVFALCPLVFGAVQGGRGSVDFYHALTGMRAAMRGEAGTAVWGNEQTLVYMWQQGTRYAFAAVARNGAPVDTLKELGAVRMNVYKASDFVRQLEANGYTRLSPNDIPLTWAQFLLSYAAAAISAGSRSLITPLILPASPLLDVRPEVEG